MKSQDLWLINTDGASRGNPGLAGVGVFITSPQGQEFSFCNFLGEKTNNEAEYEAVILALSRLTDLKARKIHIRADSELLVKQMNGEYQVKNERILQLYHEVKKLLKNFDSFRFEHVRRNENKAADRLANQAIDEREAPCPEDPHQGITVIKNIFIRTHAAQNPKGDVWFIHGYGESSLSFSEAFTSPLVNDFNLFVPDLPGFGVSPLEAEPLDQKQTTEVIHDLIKKISGKCPLYLVGHSQGGMITTWLCERFGPQVRAYVNVEGNLTKADVTFSGEAATKKTPTECKAHILDYIRTHANNEESYWRYYASLRFATADSLFCWAHAGIAYTGEKKAGEEYAALLTPKLYLWGAKNCPDQTMKFLFSHQLDSFGFDHSNHWPMIDEPGPFYEKVRSFLLNPKA